MTVETIIIFLVLDDSNIQPRLLKAEELSKTTFDCSSLHVKRWFFHKTGIINRAAPLFNREETPFDIIKRYNEGYYFCYGYKSHGYFVAKAELKVYGKLCNATMCI